MGRGSVFAGITNTGGIPNSGNALRRIFHLLTRGDAAEAIVPERLRAAISLQQAVAIRRSLPLIILVCVLAALLIGAGFWSRQPVAVSVWLAVALLPFPYLSVIAMRRRGQVLDGEAPVIVRRVHGLGIYLGIVWGSAAYLFFTVDSIPHLFLLAMTLGCLSAGVAGVVHVMPRASAFFISPPLVTFALSFALQGTLEYGLTAIMILLYGGVLLAIVDIGYGRMAELVQTKEEVTATREDMLNALESSSEAFGVFDEHGAPIVLNRHYRDLFGQRSPDLAAGEERIQRLEDGRWVKSSKRRTPRGGIVSVHTDITELKAHEEALLRARDEAESANRAKSAFLATMSHELRTPLNAVIGFAELLEMTHATRGDGKEAEYARTIAAAGRHLLSIINDILDLSKIEADQYELRDEEVDLHESADAVVAMMSAEAEAREIDLKVAIPAGLPVLQADSRAVQQILINLLSNAIKFTTPGGSVRIEAALGEEALTLRIVDSGEGIREEDLERVLEPFIQVGSALSRKTGGTGLGLPLVKRLTELHGGQLAIESTLGEGTVVSVAFPRSRLITGRRAASDFRIA